ncbi:MAG: dienelactone hydrolase family protein [Gammaproteobacteria bacterium]|nr:dienelactone hydrolase family protein [Gammaproteobacteria bacterium]
MPLDTPLETHVINPSKESIGSVIWMHGLGANNHDFDSLVPDLCHNNQLPLRFIFPNAPTRTVTINQHMPMRAWYDIYSLSDLNREDQSGIKSSEALITALIHQEIENGVPANRIALAGFSQGGAMALYTGLRQTEKIAGILGLSCYLPLFHEHAEHAHATNLNTPIFIAHGTQDMTLPCFAGKMAYDIIRQTHPQTHWKEYTMQHEITPQEINDIRQWLAMMFNN